MFRKLWSKLQDVTRLILCTSIVLVSTYAGLSAVTALHVVMSYMAISRSQWPRGPRRGSVGTAGSNPAGSMDICLLWLFGLCMCVRCQVKVSAAGRSLIQRKPTECEVS